MVISIIIPTLNEESTIQTLLKQLQVHRQQGHEVIVVDGGSNDNTCLIATPLSDQLISSESGRALQMNNGAAHSNNDILWFLHADSKIPDDSIEKIQLYLNDKNKHWGRFNIKLSGKIFYFG